MNYNPSNNQTLQIGTTIEVIKKDMLDKLRNLFFVLVAGSVSIVSLGIFFLKFDVNGILFMMIPVWTIILSLLFAFLFFHRTLSITIDDYYVSVEKVTYFGHKKTYQIPKEKITVKVKEYVSRHHGLETYLVIKGAGKRVNISDKDPGWNINHLRKICDSLGVAMP